MSESRGLMQNSLSRARAMEGFAGRGILQDILIISGLIGVQVISGGYTVLLSPFLSLGVKPMFLTIFGGLAICIFVLPLALAFERERWPSRVTPMMLSQFALIAMAGGVVCQYLMLEGNKRTSPAIASAMPNVIPGVVFIIAVCLGFEKVNMRCMYSKVKITGTIVCLGGAIAMSILQTPSSQTTSTLPSTSNGNNTSWEWIKGCLCLLGAVLVGSCNTVLQAVTMINFPAPFTLCAVVSLMCAAFTSLVQFLVDGKISVGTSAFSMPTISVLVLLYGFVIAVCMGYTTWAVKKKGPVLPSMFSPIQTVSSVIISAIILGQVVKLGSLAGMLVMFLGLYVVLWARIKEDSIPSIVDESTTPLDHHIEKPLLS